MGVPSGFGTLEKFLNFYIFKSKTRRKMKVFTIETHSRNQFVDITRQIEKLRDEYGKDARGVLVYCPHTTAAITINEAADPDVPSDLIGHLSKVIPKNSGFDHSEGNSDAHIKSTLVGASEFVIIEGGRLALGRWQGIFFCEFDGPRRRNVYVKFL